MEGSEPAAAVAAAPEAADEEYTVGEWDAEVRRSLAGEDVAGGVLNSSFGQRSSIADWQGSADVWLAVVASRVEGGVSFYEIAVVGADPLTGSSAKASVERRFSEFSAFRDAVRVQFPEQVAAVKKAPRFPRKTLGLADENAAGLRSLRVRLLDAWLQQLQAQPVLTKAADGQPRGDDCAQLKSFAYDEIRARQAGGK